VTGRRVIAHAHSPAGGERSRGGKFFQDFIHISQVASVSSRVMCDPSGWPLYSARVLITLMALAACGLMTEKRCEASCGDYLVHHGATSTRFPAGAPGTQARPGDRTEHGKPSGPCNAPSCSRRDEAPVPLPPTLPDAPAPWACLGEQIRDVASRSWQASLESACWLGWLSDQRLDRRRN
jgi:hypothetical protein